MFTWKSPGSREESGEVKVTLIVNLKAAAPFENLLEGPKISDIVATWPTKLQEPEVLAGL